MKKVAIVGAGFCGLAAAWEMVQKNHQVHLYDPAGIGGGASGISAGLLHPFSGLRAKLAKEGHAGVLATSELLKIASEALGRPVAESTGMLRLAVSDEMAVDFQRSASLHPDVEWLNAKECCEKVPGIAPLPGIWIKNALTVRSFDYLQGLWLACERQGASFFRACFQEKDYDLVLLTLGAHTNLVTPIKGQVLELAWPKGVPPLALPLNSHAYLLMQPGNRSCLAGATYERDFATEIADPERALQEIVPKVTAMVPGLKGAKLLSCRAGLRASTPDHLPLLKKMDEKTWLLTGMGSKGLLYHALYAKKLISNCAG